jgi:hypothetical protein
MLAFLLEHSTQQLVPIGTMNLLGLNEEGCLINGGFLDTLEGVKDTATKLPSFLSMPQARGANGQILGAMLEERFKLAHMDAIACASIPIIRALGMLNCKNVTTEQNPFVQHHRGKRARGPLARAVYHTLKLTLPGKQGTSSAHSIGGDALLARHIVRGHFADYRNGAGLFGRHKGVYWMPAHTRGSAQAGIVTKDYEIKTGEA